MLYVTPSTTQWSNAFLVIDEALHRNVTLPSTLVGSLRMNAGTLGYCSHREQSEIRDDNIMFVL